MENEDIEVSDEVYVVVDPVDTSYLFEDYPVPDNPPLEVEGEGAPPEE